MKKVLIYILIYLVAFVSIFWVGKVDANSYRLRGDVNGDGNIWANDTQLTAQHIVGIRTLTDDDLLAADNDGNGLVNSGDLIYSMRYIVELIDEMPGGEYI